MNKEVQTEIERAAEQLYVWHCESQNIPQEPFVRQNDYVRGYWIDKAKQILLGHGLGIIDTEKKSDGTDVPLKYYTDRHIWFAAQSELIDKANYKPVILLEEVE